MAEMTAPLLLLLPKKHPRMSRLATLVVLMNMSKRFTSDGSGRANTTSLGVASAITLVPSGCSVSRS